ncbi:hypothetical protein AAGU50_09550 [Aeromonas dhakensis]|uniref:hypothetical protein n=1 Tax=Aeromonas dhakensis TaxID=196024 RepID=UPI003F85BAB9
MSTERYLVKSYGDNKDGAKAGLHKMLDSLQYYNSAVIIVPMLQNIKKSILADILGQELTNKLMKDRVISYNGKEISLCAQSALSNYRGNDIYLDLWGNEKSVSNIESLNSSKVTILVTWLPQDSQKWEEQKKPIVIYDDVHC